MADNYNTLFESSRERFLTFAQEPMIRHFGLAHDKENLYLHLLGKEAVLDRKTGVLTCEGKAAGFNESCTLYDILSRAENAPRLSGEWVSITQLGGNIATHHSERLNPSLRALEGRCEELKALCRSWGGVEQRQGDVSFIVPLFDFFPVWVQFWEGDEEFPSRFACLWEANTLDFMFYETSWYANGYLLGLLTGKGSR